MGAGSFIMDDPEPAHGHRERPVNTIENRPIRNRLEQLTPHRTDSAGDADGGMDTASLLAQPFLIAPVQTYSGQDAGTAFDQELAADRTHSRGVEILQQQLQSLG